MTTSLEEQLKRLKVPQTSVLIDSKKKPSLIFDEKEAATKDRKTIFELGKSGITELITLNPAFTQFEQTLFDENSIQIERSVEDSKVNKLLNLAIKKFFHYLSPYFMLQPAHLCLEWLIRRFHINEFNTDEFIDLILPYHETKTFVKCLQVINLRDGKWKWLKASQKAGVPLSKTALQNCAANDTVFLKLICKSTLESIEELGTRSNTLQTRINFYCITVMGALEKAEISESHISCLLLPILKGFSSNSLDFAATSFMITAQLVSKINLKIDILESLISKICKVEHQNLQKDIILLNILIYQTQSNIVDFPEKLLLNFISKKSLIGNLNELSNSKIKIDTLFVPLIRACFHKIHSKDAAWIKCKDFLSDMFNEVHFQEYEAQNIIRSILENNQNTKKKFSESEIVEIDSENENEFVQVNIEKIYSSYLHQLEKQYPSAFDSVVKETMEGQNNISEKRKQALKSVLAFRLKSSYSEDSSSIYENLYHPNSVNRIAAIKYLIENFNNLTSTEEGKTMVKYCIMDRLSDDDPEVLIEVLKISSEQFSDITDKKELLEKLIAIVHKCYLQNEDWFPIKSFAIEHITSLEIVKSCDANRILLILLRLIVSNHESDLRLMKKISKKDSIKFIPFIKEYFALNLNKSLTTIKDFDSIMRKIKCIPTPESILSSFETVNENFYCNSVNSSFILLFLGYSFSRYEDTQIEYKLKGFEIFEIIQKFMQFSSQPDQIIQNIQPNKVCLTLALNFLLSLLKGITVDTKKFSDKSKGCKLLENIFEVVITKSFSSKDKFIKEEYSICLQSLLKQTFSSSIEKLEYLSYYFLHDRINEHKIDYEFQIRAIKLFNCIINKNKQNLTINRHLLIKIILGLHCSNNIVRQITLETLNNIKSNAIINENDILIISKILESSQEILMDEIQIIIVFYTLLCPKKTNNKDNVIALDLLDSILKILEDDMEENVFKVIILNVMKLTNNRKILDNLMDLGWKVLEEAKLRSKNNRIGFDYYTGEIYKSIVERFDSETISIIEKNNKSWDFIQSSLNHHNILINTNGKLQSIASIIMSIFEDGMYSKMSASYKEKFLRLVFEIMATSEENSVSTTGSKLIKRLEVDGNHLKHILIEMKDVCPTNTVEHHRMSLFKVTSLNTVKWKTGITLLELLQNWKNIENCEILIPILFDLLRKCLEFEEQVALDYAKQLILSCLINLCQKVQGEKNFRNKLKDSTLKMDLVVQCIRSTQNPQTHHHALMLLSQCAYIVPEQILHNITDVFTFMGSSVVRHDDAFSFQIIFNLIESVIPMLVEACSKDLKNEPGNRDKKVVPILKVFSDIILDVPEHRRLLLYTKLISTLDAQEYFWMFLCILFESHVVNDKKDSKSKTGQHQVARNISPDELPKRLSIALQLSKDFEPAILIETCRSLFIHLQKLPEEKSNEQYKKTIDLTDIETSLFEVNTHTAKQLRHYKFTILQYMSTLTSSPEFVNSIRNLNEESTKAMKPYYQNYIIKILSFIPSVTKTVDKNLETNQLKFWKIILYHCTEILDNAISLLSADTLLLVVHGLMQHQISVVRKRVIELLNEKLQYKTDYFSKCKDENMLMLLTPLKDIITSILNKNQLENVNINNDEIIIQHLALIAVKLLSRTLALKHVEEFKEILNLLSKILKKRASVSRIITAAVVLAISEISSNLKAHSISNLYKFMPHMIEVLNDQAENILLQSPDNILLAILTAVYKLFDSLPLFLGPYYMDTLTLLIKIWIRLDNRTSDNRTAMLYSKLNSIWTKISISIPLRLLTPHCEKIYTKLLEEKNYNGIIYLMKLLNESFTNTAGTDINLLNNELTKFFLIVLDFRTNLTDYEDINEINEIENHILQTFVCLILKLSESSFRPLYQILYDWAIRNSQNDKNKSIDRAITYFSLSGQIAEALKSLFVLFANDFIQDAADLLNECNSKQLEDDNEDVELSDANEKQKYSNKYLILLEKILKTLYNIFLYDTQDFINTHRFDILMEPITNQLENPLILNNTNLQSVLLNCISQLVVVVSNDVLWKQLNYQILLKSRSNQFEIKILSLNTCVEIARKLGEDFSSLLPETIPFMAELLEDENQNVEKAARKAVQELEKVVGESLQKYF